MNIVRKIKMEIISPSRSEEILKKYNINRKEKMMISTGQSIREIEQSLLDMNEILPRACNMTMVDFHKIIHSNLSDDEKCALIKNRGIIGKKPGEKVNNDPNDIRVHLKDNLNLLASEYGSINNVPSSIYVRGYTDMTNGIIEKSGKIKREILRYDRVLPEFKKGMPMGLSSQRIRIYPNEDGEFYFVIWGVLFKTILRKDKQKNRDILYEIINNNDYKLSDSTLSVFKNGKNTEIYFNMTVKIPESKELYDRGIICGLDLGMKTLVTCAVCDKATGNVITDEHSKKEIIGKIGDGSTIIEFRNKYKIEGERIRKKCEMMGVNSHGRNAKMEEYYKYIHNKERNAAKNIYHTVSRKVIKLCKENNAGVIQMENLEGYGKKECVAASLWGYYELQKMIEYKAKKEGIEVKYVNPKNTSKTCSECYGVNESLTLKDREWVCPHCGKHHDRDVNAAINIARM